MVSCVSTPIRLVNEIATNQVDEENKKLCIIVLILSARHTQSIAAVTLSKITTAAAHLIQRLDDQRNDVVGLYAKKCLEIIFNLYKENGFFVLFFKNIPVMKDTSANIHWRKQIKVTKKKEQDAPNGSGTISRTHSSSSPQNFLDATKGHRSREGSFVKVK